jgi:anti-sigma factor RsiW
MGDRVRNEISELLPFYLNGTLSVEEKAKVEHALTTDAGLKAELKLLDRIRTSVQEEDAGYSPGELGLARLGRDLSPSATVRRPSLAALAAAFALGAILAGVIAVQAMRAPEEPYRQAGLAPAEESLLVAFRADATAREISDLLVAGDYAIVDGPSALGLFHVSPPEGVDPAAAVADLAAAAAIVESAEIAR